MVEGLDDSHRHLQPTPAGKTAGWLIGHLSVTGDFARKLCGRPPICPAEWRAVFNPGTQPSTDAAVYPPMLNGRKENFFKLPMDERVKEEVQATFKSLMKR